MKHSNAMFAGTLVLLVLAGCGSSRDRGMVIVPPPPPPPPTEFTTFVKAQFAATSDTTDPEDVDSEDFAFSANDDPTAFDDILQ
ncbi:MAG: hypothetical protein RIA65_05080 [Woeseia sp.]